MKNKEENKEIISSNKLKKMIDEILHLRAVMIYEIRYMGEDLLEKITPEKKEK